MFRIAKHVNSGNEANGSLASSGWRSERESCLAVDDKAYDSLQACHTHIDKTYDV